MNHATPSVTRSESPAALAAKVRAHFDGAGTAVFARESLASWRRAVREQLGLPLDRPIVMTGHQAGIWHAGIAEKFLLGAEVAALCGGVLVHVVVDHDLNDAALVAYPALVAGKLERIYLDRSPRRAGPNALRKPVRMMRAERAHDVPAELEPALAAIEAAVRANFSAPNLAMQMAGAANALLAVHARVDVTLAATQLARTTLAHAIRRDFGPMRDAYNAALAGQRIARLAADELPFWRLDAKECARFPLLASDAAATAEVAPRALTLTAIARLAACDLFIHGTGGAKYDLAMESWIAPSLGQAASAELAPMAVATASRYAPLAGFTTDIDAGATPRALRELEQDPFGDAGATKSALRARITGTRGEKRAAFVTMRREIDAARSRNAAEIASLRARIAANREALRVHALAFDRAWPFPFSA